MNNFLLQPTVLLITFVIMHTSCTDWLQKNKDDDSSPSIELSSDTSAILTVQTKVEKKNVSIEIGNIPENSELKCELDYQPHKDCSKEMVLENLDDGEYLLHVLAIRSGETQAVGESYFVVGKSSGGIPSIQENNELSLSLDNSAQNGMARNLENDASVKFTLAKNPDCTPEFFCSHGDKVTTYWKKCTKTGQHTVSKKFLAKGLQYIHVRAQCKNKIGPTLSHYFYGVDSRYFKDGKVQPLTLDFVHDRKEKKYIFHLMKANDCQESNLKFLCKTAADSETDCDRVHIAPPDSFSIKAECNGRKGPELSIKEIDGI
ncbi:hypothetical protein N9D31_01955 [Oligoflexaceae bacterium]|nr:hypothetical protein [Oligoflexaceae bacterium]